MSRHLSPGAGRQSRTSATGSWGPYSRWGAGGQGLMKPKQEQKGWAGLRAKDRLLR